MEAAVPSAIPSASGLGQGLGFRVSSPKPYGVDVKMVFELETAFSVHEADVAKQFGLQTCPSSLR